MNSHFGKNRVKVLWGALLALVLLAIAGTGFIFKARPPLAMDILRPVLIRASEAREYLNTAVGLFFDKERLRAENKYLREMVENMRARFMEASVLKKENEELRHALNREPEDKVMARILTSSEGIFNSFLIDAGEKNGIKEGAPVLSPGGVYLGRVSEVYSRSAKAVLFTHPSQNSEVYLQSSGVPATARGTGAGMAEISIPSSVGKMEVGERVILAEEGNYPLGIIDRVEAEEADPFQNLIFRSPVNINYLRFIVVVK